MNTTPHSAPAIKTRMTVISSCETARRTGSYMPSINSIKEPDAPGMISAQIAMAAAKKKKNRLGSSTWFEVKPVTMKMKTAETTVKIQYLGLRRSSLSIMEKGTHTEMITIPANSECDREKLSDTNVEIMPERPKTAPIMPNAMKAITSHSTCATFRLISLSALCKARS